jgi:hypothetical protein
MPSDQAGPLRLVTHLLKFVSVATFKNALQVVFAKRLIGNHSGSTQDAVDWSAALNAMLMLPVGALLSLSLHPILTPASFHSTADLLVSWQEPTPTSAAPHYVLGVIFCFLLSTCAAMYRPFPALRLGSGKTAYVLLAFLSVMLACISLLCQDIIYKDGRAWPAWIALVAYATVLEWYRRNFPLAVTGKPIVGELFPAERTMPMSVSGYAGDICAFIFFFLIFWPYPFSALLDQWSLKNAHAIAYLIGPAQLAQVPGNLPNVDYFSQYTLAIPYIFSWALSSDVAQVVARYLYGMTVGMIFFAAMYYYLLSRLYMSRFWAFAFTLLMLAFLANAIPWGEPSSSPLRFLFFPICAIVLLRYGLSNSVSIIAASILCALAIMNNTETGIHTALAYVTVLFIASPSWQKFSRHSALLIFGAIAGVVALCLLCFGWGALSLDFLIGNLRPLFVYSIAGYGNYPLSWDLKHWTWLQCLVVPGVVTLMLALFYYKTWTDRALTRTEQSLTFCGAFGLLLFLKFMYRSFLALGHVNAGPLIVVSGFWFVFSLRKAIQINRWRSSWVHVIAFALSLSTFVVFLHTFRENYLDRDVKFFATWLEFPSIFNRLAGVTSGAQNSVPLAEQVSTMFSDVDVALIQKYAEPASEPIWVFADEDWAYLLRAERKPATTVLPSVAGMLMDHDLSALKAKFERNAAQYVFIQRKYEALLSSDHPAAMYPKFREHYVFLEHGKDLGVYKRKAN